MPTKLPKDFKPDERSYNNLRKHGAIPEFVDDQLPQFIVYWQETGKKKASWQMTLQVWIKRAWAGKAGSEWERARHYRKDYQGPQENIFDLILDEMQGLKKPTENFKPPRNFKVIVNRPDLGTMTAEQGIEALAAWRKGK